MGACGSIWRYGSALSALWVALLGGAAASAQEIDIGLRSEGLFNSNYLGRQNDEVASFSTQTGPRIAIHDPTGRLTYDLEYRGWYTWYVEPWDSDINDWEQSVRLSSSYAITQRTQATVTNVFRDLSNVRFADEDVVDNVDTIAGGRRQLFRNAFGFELEHAFTPRLNGALVVNNDWINFKQNINQSDSISTSVRALMNYAVNREDTVGAGVGYAYQEFEEQSVQVPASTGQIWNAFASWTHRFDDDFRFELAGGPTFITTKTSNRVQASNFGFVGGANPGFVQTPCNPGGAPAGFFLESNCVGVPTQTPPAGVALVGLPFLDGDDSQDDFTFFARVNLIKRWIDWEFRALYQRSQSNAAGDGGTSTLDRVQLRANYDFNELWEFYGTAGWTRRERATKPIQIEDFVVVASVADPTYVDRVAVVSSRGSRRQDVSQVSIALGSRRRFTRQVNGRFEFRYRYQYRDRDIGGNTTTNFFLLSASIEYNLAPIYL